MNRNRSLAVLLALGLYLSARGYHSRDGDQAYRLPLLLHYQDASIFAEDPFVKALDVFNPHRGYLAVLDLTSRPFGLSVALFGLFALTFCVTCLAVDRLAREAWPESGAGVGVAAVLMVLAAKAGNIGTNHLFESMLLDRLIAFSLGWTAFAAMIADPDRGKWAGALAIGLAGSIHPSLGLQLGMLAIAGWIAWAIGGRWGVSIRSALLAIGLIVAALSPTLITMARAASHLFDGLSSTDFLLLSASIQSPQHMLPHLWRIPQWLAWSCYPILAILAMIARGPAAFDGARGKLTILLLLNLVGLGLAWFFIEVIGSRFAITFQPFRMATIARGLCLILIADRVQALWSRGDRMGRLRAVLIVVGLTGDWSMVVVTLVEMAAWAGSGIDRKWEQIAAMATLGLGIAFLARNDTESGHARLLAAMGISFVLSGLRRFRWDRRRMVAATALAWIIPLVAILSPTARPLASHWRFGEYPGDDVERLAVWCRDHTPIHARFVTPPGPKTFRLWSRREVAFNRASSPYHAAGLADWSLRFRDHVGFRGSVDEFAAAYLKDRQALEHHFEELSDDERARLARRQGADYVVASAPKSPRSAGPLTLLHVEGRYAVYLVK